MKCVISGGNIKIIARAIQMLSKIGEEVFIEPYNDNLSLRTVNISNSAFASVTFHDNYFSYYAFEDGDKTDDLKCKIVIRSALAVFKTPSLLDKQVESCHIQLEPNAEKVCFILKYKNGIIKTHLVMIVDTDTIKANYKKEGTASRLCIQPRVMNDAIQNFQQNLLEITLEVLQEKVLIRNYIDENSNISNETRTQLVFGSGEFDQYKISADSTITFCLKELRAIAHFADALAQPIEINFDRPGRPVVFVCQSDTLEMNLVLATLNPHNDISSQSTVSTRPVPKKAAPRRAAPKAKSGLKSLSKKSFTDLNKSNNTTANTSLDVGNTESIGRISDISETPSQNVPRNINASSRTTCTPKGINTNSHTEGQNSLKKNPFSSFSKRKSNEETPKTATENNAKKNALSCKRKSNEETTPSSRQASNASTGRRASVDSTGKNPFSSFSKRKSDDEISNSPQNYDNDELVPNSPPKRQSKRAKLIFQKCFQATFDPNTLPGHNDVEVEDSGGESD